MKKIINGKMYNCETANPLFSVDVDGGMTAWGYTKETLYRKNNGEYFLFRSGGYYYDVYDKMGVIVEPHIRFIIPLTIEEVHIWSEAFMPVEMYCELFGEPEE